MNLGSLGRLLRHARLVYPISKCFAGNGVRRPISYKPWPQTVCRLCIRCMCQQQHLYPSRHLQYCRTGRRIALHYVHVHNVYMYVVWTDTNPYIMYTLCVYVCVCECEVRPHRRRHKGARATAVPIYARTPLMHEGIWTYYIHTIFVSIFFLSFFVHCCIAIYVIVILHRAFVCRAHMSHIYCEYSVSQVCNTYYDIVIWLL